MVKLLHFADAHIDMANYGRHDPESGLPMRVMDFLKSLDEIVQTALDEKVNLVIFAGDAYKTARRAHLPARVGPADHETFPRWDHNHPADGQP